MNAPPVLVLDTETYLMQPGRMAPKVVCVALRYPDGRRTLVRPCDPALDDALLGAAEGDYHICGHNVAYDMACLGRTRPDLVPLIFRLYMEYRVVDTILVYKLWLLKRGLLAEDEGDRKRKFESFSLDAMAQKLLGRPPLDKGADGWRLRYGTLEKTALNAWPKRAIKYALDDVQIPFELLEHLEWTDFPDLMRQTSYAFPLHLTAVWGLRTHGPDVATFCVAWSDKSEAAYDQARHLGIFRENGSKDTKALQGVVEDAWRQSGVDPELWERTPGGKLSTSKDTLAELAEKVNLPALKAVADYNHAQKALNTFGKVFLQGVKLPIHPRIDSLKATGRVSMSKPNLQQLPREAGFRELFVPREGNVYIATDIDTAEVRAYGQSMLDLVGWSRIAEGYQKNPAWDPHTYPMGAAIEGRGRTEAEALAAKGTKEFKEFRNMAKGANFGLPGGMGAKRLIDYVRGYGVTIDEAKAWDIKHLYERTFPETVIHGRQVAAQLDANGGELMVVTPRSKRARLCTGSRAYSQARNSAFQPIVADITKLAGLYVAYGQYVAGVDARLYNTRTVNMVHDELNVEAPRGCYREAAVAVEEAIIKAAKVWCPDVPFRAGSTAMARLQKGDPIYNERGELEVLP